ncbi:MAG TPA: polysaccharide deacetylase family protein, partial [Ktedonobacteraceae bacterium]|nr:polysaccharide deacetylase family protein [Ktedonobacteraceae bacterium]
MLAVSLFASLVATNVGSLVSAASVQNLKATPRVSFTFDDGLASAVTLAAPTLATYGLTGTNYIITDCVGMTTVPNTCAADQNSSYMTWDQIAQLKGFGWEIGSHTKSHIQLSTDKPTAAALTSQLKDSQSALAAHGYAATDLAFPYGDYDTNVLAQTAKYYESARGFADLGYNTWPYDNTLIVNEQVQEGTAVGNIKGVTYAQVKAYIDAAITNNQWLVLTFHGITSTTPTKADDYHTSTGLLGQIAQYVQQQQTAGKIKAVNIEDGLVRGTNLLANGDFSQGIAAGWTTDDATNIKADNANNGRYPDPTHSISVKTPAGNTVDKHLFSPTISVSSTDSYILK